MHLYRRDKLWAEFRQRNCGFASSLPKLCVMSPQVHILWQAACFCPVMLGAACPILNPLVGPQAP